MSDSPGFLPLPPSLRKRFYEPVVLLDALREVYLKDNKTSEPDLESSRGKSPKETYFCFLNKLSQIFDNQPKQPLGKTVSAIVVIDSGTIEYRLASNQRDSRELNTVTEYLTGILTVLGEVTDDEVGDKPYMRTIFSGILQKVLAFNRERVEVYMGALLQNDRLGFCIKSAAGDGSDQGQRAADALRELQPHLEAASKAPLLDNDEFARHAESLLQTIHTHWHASPSSLEEYLKTKSRGDNTMPDSPWSEARHALGRLLSYFIAIKVLISARKFWPRLFVDFSVTSIPSSAPLSKPPDIRRNAQRILQRMSRNQSTIKAYQAHAASLQKGFNLDARIRARVSQGRFRPIVHAEVNLLHSVLRSQVQAEAEGEDPLRFFNEAEFGRYVGSSKPTCLLCRFYFAAHPSGVGCRGTHGNLYYNWRAPDVYAEPGVGGGIAGFGGEEREEEVEEEGEARQRQLILERMVKEVRGEVERAIKERSYTRRKHDSRDTPSDPLWSTVAGGSEVREEVDFASRMGQWDVSSARCWSAGDSVAAARDSRLAEGMGQINLDAASTMGWRDDAQETTLGSLDVGEDEDQDGGGARL